jgi:hypothetical protein
MFACINMDGYLHGWQTKSMSHTWTQPVNLIL